VEKVKSLSRKQNAGKLVDVWIISDYVMYI